MNFDSACGDTGGVFYAGACPVEHAAAEETQLAKNSDGLDSQQTGSFQQPFSSPNPEHPVRLLLMRVSDPSSYDDLPEHEPSHAGTLHALHVAMIQAVHLALLAKYPNRPFTDSAFNAEVWRRLRIAFKDVYAAVIMPDHLHVIPKTAEPLAARDRLIHVQRGLSRGLMKEGLFHPVEIRESIPNAHHLKRQVRYVHLNPCREGLTRDPAAWNWTTHRDYIGATFPSWPNIPEAMRAMGFPAGREGIRRFHNYVSGDPTCDPRGTQTPEIPKDFVGASFQASKLAFASAVRVHSSLLNRKGQVRSQFARVMANEMGLGPSEVARRLAIQPQSIRPSSSKNRALAQAITMILSDRRLLDSC